MKHLPFAVFDEFGVPADDRLQDQLTDAYAEGRKDEREYLLGRFDVTMAVCDVSAADRYYVLTSIKDL